MDQEKNIVIIGCGASGGTAAQFARKTDRKASITIFEEGPYSQYSKCGLPYFLSKEIPKIDNLIEFDEEWFKNANIDLKLNTKVEKIDKNKKIVYARNGDETYKKPYDSLIICTGAKPVKPPIQNIRANGVFSVRSINDAKKIEPYIQKNKHAVIIGAGLIGLEMANTFFNKGMKVTIIEKMPDILPNIIDNDMAKIVKDHIPKDVEIYTNHIATKIETKNDKVSKVQIKNNKTEEEKIIDVDIIIVAAAVIPNVELAKSIGCKIGEKNGIIVNNKNETSVKNVFAAGDCTQYFDFITAKPILIGLGSIAVRQAISAGINAAEGDYELLKGFLSTLTSEFFGIEIASVGPITKKLEDFTVISGHYNGYSLPDYFPGGKPVSIKVLVDRYTGMIMNAQCVGDKAAQRINTFACAIIGELDIETFRKLETAYAPTIAPTLDVITLVCDIISKKLKHK